MCNILMMKKQSIFILISVLSFAFVPKENVKVQNLPNGLRVIILPREEIDLVSVQLWLKVGSVRDDDKPGLLHLLEHMLFNGSEKYPPGAIDEKIEEMGGRISAETGQDFTYISVEIRPNFLPAAMDILSDLVQHPLFDENELEREKKIVIAEIKGARNPFQESAWQLSNLMFKQHPYRNPIPGYEDIVARISKEDLLSAWQRYYLPCLTSLIVVGRVESEKVFQLARHFFQDWENKAPPPPFIPNEPPIEGVRYVSHTYQPYSLQTGDKGVRSYIAFGFSAPSVEQREGVIALDLLNQIIEDGKLFRSLREEGYVSEIHSFFLTQRYPSMFIVYASTWGNVIEYVRKAVLEELLKFVSTINEEALSKAKSSLLFSFYRNCETYSHQAHILGFYESIADFSFACDYPQMVKEMTLEELKREWRSFIRDNAYCFVSLSPQK